MAQSDAPSHAGPRQSTTRRPRRIKRDAEIVLICNPRAGGRWKELAGILDSDEARDARRIVTDSVEDIAMALDHLGKDTRLLCIYGGDGTIQRILDRLSPEMDERIYLALLGGGTMNVTSRWCGFSPDPGKNFRHVVRAFHSGTLHLRELPLLEVTAGDDLHRGFTFGMGPIVRLLDAYERGKKGKVAAVGTAARAVAAIWLGRPASYERMLGQMHAQVTLDGELLPYDQFSALFANVTGQINPGIEPFATDRKRDSFYCAAYAVSAREISLALPFLARGWVPWAVNLGNWIRRTDAPAIGADPRYANRPASQLIIDTPERLYTVDGEILESASQTISVRLGPMLRLAVGPEPG